MNVKAHNHRKQFRAMKTHLSIGTGVHEIWVPSGKNETVQVAMEYNGELA